MRKEFIVIMVMIVSIVFILAGFAVRLSSELPILVKLIGGCFVSIGLFMLASHLYNVLKKKS